jgi:hypothetical protein
MKMRGIRTLAARWRVMTTKRNYGKTARGTPITDELVEERAREAEAIFRTTGSTTEAFRRSCQSASRGSIGPEASGRADPLTEYTVIWLGRASSPSSENWKLANPDDA